MTWNDLGKFVYYTVVSFQITSFKLGIQIILPAC